MYPRNAASPPRISIGAVVQISDGAVQTTGVTVKVIPQGGSEASGSGTVAYSADGVVLYTPTQGETNYTAMVFVASKTGCIPATVTVVTSASGTAGYAGLDWAKIIAPTTTVALTGTSISASQIADAVWDEIMSTHTVNGSYGSHVVRSVNQNQNTVGITGSQHIAADVHAFQAAVIDSAAFAANWLTAAGTAADYITELQAAIGTATNQTAILDRQGYTLAVLAGTISDAQTAAETYSIILGANTYTVDFAGLDTSGNRSGQTLVKT